MRRRFVSLTGLSLALAFGTSAALADNGSITGKLTLKGGKDAAAKRIVLDMSANEDCKKLHGDKKVGSETEIVSKDGEVQNVIVYIKEGLGDKKFAAPAEPVELDQKQCVYVPHAFGVMVGQKLLIKNTDATLHNVHGQPVKNEEFNTPQPAAGAPIEKVFKRAEEPFLVKCDVHPWMGAYCGVFDHPYFAVTAKDGTFTLKDVPPGEYKIEAWHEVYGKKDMKVTVASGAPATANIEMEPAKK